MKRVFLISVFMIFSAMLQASDYFPSACKTFDQKTDMLTLNSKEPTLFLIRNQLDNELWIAVRSSSALPVEPNSRLQKGHILGFVTDVHPLTFYCVEVRPGHEQQISCKDSITVCQWEKITFPDKLQKPAWAIEDLEMPEVIGALAAQGFTTSSG